MAGRVLAKTVEDAVEDAVEVPDATAKKNNDHWRVVDVVVASVVSVAVGAIFWAWSAGYAGIAVVTSAFPLLGELYGAGKSTFALTLAGLITELLDAGTAVVSVTHDEEFTEGSLQSGLAIVLRGIAIAPPGIILLGRWSPCAWWDC